MFPTEKTFETGKELVDFFLHHSEDFLSDGVLFRGHSSQKYKLIPNALREDNLENLFLYAGEPYNKSHINGFTHQSYDQVRLEFEILKRFYLKADKSGLILPICNRVRDVEFYYKEIVKGNEFWIPEDMFEVASLAQHYGLPTRLLDWTSSFFTALYFAASGAAKKLIKDKVEKRPLVSDQIVIWVLNSDYFGKEIKEDKSFKLKLINPPRNGNPNLNAQSGMFTLWETPRLLANQDEAVDRRPLDELVGDIQTIIGPPVMMKLKISTTKCFDILNLIERIGYDASKIFPGYDGVVKSMYENGMLIKDKLDPLIFDLN